MKSLDHRARVTRLLLRRALTELMRTKPPQRISVKELCLAAGITRGTFYSHYSDIYQLLDSIESELLDELSASLRPLLDSDESEASLRGIALSIFRCLKDNADICALTLGPHGDRDFAARLISIGRERYMDMYRRLYPDATPRELEWYYAFVSGGCIGLLERWMREGMLTSAEEMADMVSNIIARGAGFMARRDAQCSAAP